MQIVLVSFETVLPNISLFNKCCKIITVYIQVTMKVVGMDGWFNKTSDFNT